MPAPLISRRALAAGLAVLPAALNTSDRAIAAAGEGDGLSHSALRSTRKSSSTPAARESMRC
jgi:hypothetical protein